MHCDHGEIIRTIRSPAFIAKCNWKDVSLCVSFVSDLNGCYLQVALLLASYEGNLAKVSYLLDNEANKDCTTEVYVYQPE